MEKILKELKEIKSILSQIVGSNELPASERFSIESIRKAATEFRSILIEREAWISERDISKVIRKAPWNAGKFIIERFEFKNYFVRGRTYYFKKSDLVDLNKELKKRNINLGRYIELEADREKFLKYIESIKDPKRPKKHLRYKIPDNLRDIQTQPYHHPAKEKVQEHLAELKRRYEEEKLIQYIDIYGGNYAMFKHIYYFDRYLDKGLVKKCNDWCFQFNYANNALREISKIRSQVIY